MHYLYRAITHGAGSLLPYAPFDL